MKDNKISKVLFLLVQIATVAVFFGRAWQHIFWDAPYRVMIWDEKLMSGIVNAVFGMTWDEFVTNPHVDENIQYGIVGLGFFYLICTLVTIFIQKLPDYFRYFLLLGSLNLVILAICYMKVYFFSLGQLMEYTLQFSTPVFLFFLTSKNYSFDKLTFWMKVAIALTFTCHGLYAVGYYPQPGNFVQMVISILGFEDGTAHLFLKIAGILDFVISIMIFLPARFAVPALVYAVGWGFATSLARVWANFYPELWSDSLFQWSNETIFRFPHFLIPAALCIYYWAKEGYSLKMPSFLSRRHFSVGI